MVISSNELRHSRDPFEIVQKIANGVILAKMKLGLSQIFMKGIFAFVSYGQRNSINWIAFI
jgi:hypothetical protein